MTRAAGRAVPAPQFRAPGEPAAKKNGNASGAAALAVQTRGEISDGLTRLMSAAALDCRADAGRHAWSRMSQTLPKVKRGDVSVVVVRRCECGVEREDEFALPSWELVNRRIRYPRDEDGNDIYLIPPEFKGQGRQPVSAYRRALFSRVTSRK